MSERTGFLFSVVFMLASSSVPDSSLGRVSYPWRGRPVWRAGGVNVYVASIWEQGLPDTPLVPGGPLSPRQRGIVMTTVEADTREITTTLAEFMVGLHFGDIPSELLDKTKLYTLECLAHMVSAHAQEVSKLVMRYLVNLGAHPQAIVVGGDLKTAVAEAAYANGTLAHADELESHGTLPGTGLVPPIAAGISVGDFVKGTSGSDLIAAIFAGIEMQGRLGTAGIGACDRGFMGISLVGPGGAAVTAGKLFSLEAEQMRNCLGIALPLSNGSLRGCGYMTHVHEAGVPTRSGVFAAQLAADGFTGCPDFLDGAHSWGDQYAGDAARPYRPEVLTADLGASFFLATCDVAPKQYGSCGLTHQTIEGTITLMRDNGLRPSDIETVDLEVPPWADRVASFQEPNNGEQAKFSIRQGVAALLVDGVPQLPYLRPFSDETCNDPRYGEARTRVNLTIEQGGESQRGFAQQTVTLNLKNGETLTKTVDAKSIRGHVANPYTTDERIDMARHLLERLGTDRTERVIEMVMNMERHTVADVSDVIG
jgi:2-methylcitrate dehydratase PrpD